MSFLYDSYPYLPISNLAPNQLDIAYLTGEQLDNNLIEIHRTQNSVVVGNFEIDLETPLRVVVVTVSRNNYVVTSELLENEIIKVDRCMIDRLEKLRDDRTDRKKKIDRWLYWEKNIVMRGGSEYFHVELPRDAGTSVCIRYRDY